MAERATSVERIAPWAAGALIALPVLLSRYPPMADVPLHEAAVGLLRHWGDSRYVPANVYELNLGLGNQLFSLLILALAYVVPIGTATKLVVATTLFLLPVAAARLADHLGVTRIAAVLVAPIGLGWLFFLGLLANLMGLGVYLASLPSLDRFCERPTRRGFATACGWMVLLHFTHDMMALIAAATLVLFTACAPRSAAANVARLGPAALAVALVWSTQALGARHLHHAPAGLVERRWLAVWPKIANAPSFLYEAVDRGARDLIFVACLVPTLLFAIERWRGRAHTTCTWRQRLHDFRFELLAASLFVAYLAAPAVRVVPVARGGATLLHPRLIAPAWVLLTLAACARGRHVRPWPLPRLLALLAPLAPLLASWPAFVDNDRVFKGLDAAIPHMEPGSAYLVVELGEGDADRLVHPLGGVGHVVGSLGGRGLYDFTFSETSPVYLRREKQWTTIVDRMTGHPYAMMPSYDLTHFRYALLHSSDATIATVAALAMTPEARVLFQEGEWTVMESTLPLVPIDSPDEPTPVPWPKTLHERCLEVAATLRNTPM